MARAFAGGLWLSLAVAVQGGAQADQRARLAGREPAPTHLGGDARAEVYARATNEFAEADFYKPAPGEVDSLEFKLAPLMLQEVRGGTAETNGLEDQFGFLSISNGVVGFDRSRPTVLMQVDNAEAGVKVNPRFSYLWCYGEGGSVSTIGLAWQGIRVTLDRAGKPVVWEILADDSEAELIYVAASLEAAARAEFGAPLPGRRHAVERAVSEAPRVVVARVIEDGPVPQGPLVYLRRGTRAVSTVICRCMPAQAKRLVRTSTYDLAPFDPARTTPAGRRTAFWPGEGDSRRLERCLRLPKSF